MSDPPRPPRYLGYDHDVRTAPTPGGCVMGNRVIPRAACPACGDIGALRMEKLNAIACLACGEISEDRAVLNAIAALSDRISALERKQSEMEGLKGSGGA